MENSHCKRHCKREHKSKSSGILQAAMPTPPPPAGAYNPSGGYPAGGYPGGAPQPIYNPVSTKRYFVIAGSRGLPIMLAQSKGLGNQAKLC